LRVPPAEFAPHNIEYRITKDNNNYKQCATHTDEQKTSEIKDKDQGAEDNPLKAISHTVNHSLDRFKKMREARREAAKNSKATPNTINKFWNDVYRDAWPDFPTFSFSPKEKGCARNLIKGYQGDDLLSFVEWSIYNWHMVGKSKFPEKRGVTFPKQPDFQFFFNFRKNFIEVYNDKEFYSKLAHHTNAGLVIHLMKQGYSADDAFEEAKSVKHLRQREGAVMDRETRLKKEELRLHAREIRLFNEKRMNPGALTSEQRRAQIEAHKKKVDKGNSKEVRPININITPWE